MRRNGDFSFDEHVVGKISKGVPYLIASALVFGLWIGVHPVIGILTGLVGIYPSYTVSQIISHKVPCWYISLKDSGKKPHEINPHVINWKEDDKVKVVFSNPSRNVEDGKFLFKSFPNPNEIILRGYENNELVKLPTDDLSVVTNIDLQKREKKNQEEQLNKMLEENSHYEEWLESRKEALEELQNEPQKIPNKV